MRRRAQLARAPVPTKNLPPSRQERSTWRVALLGLGSVFVCSCAAPSMPRTSPLQSVDNAHPEMEWVELQNVGCTGRDSEATRCTTYTVRVFADGRVHWEGHQHVQPLGPARSKIAPASARRLIAYLRQQAPRLATRECGYDHARYFGIVLGESGQASLPLYWSCGRPYRAVARRISRVAGISRQKRFRSAEDSSGTGPTP